MEQDESTHDDENTFYFESDHLVLRGNPDYSNLIRTIAVLEAQRVRAHRELNELIEAKRRYMNDPELFLRKLKDNDQIIAANSFAIAKLPEIGAYDLLPPKEVKIKEEPGSLEKVAMVRGRLVDETKPATFNRLWTCDEQRRLEQLLIEYPVEPFESRRYAKIAKALGNRTPQQVSSRVQKYFQKLYDAGLPIPGRIPKKRRNGHCKTRRMYRPSTFFPAHNIPFHMPDDDDFQLSDLHGSLRSPAPAQHDSDAGSSFGDPQRSETRERTVYLLKLIRDEKKAMLEGYNPDPMAGKCEACQVEAVSRMRWRCKTCCCFLSLCTDCLTGKLVDQRFEHISHDVVVDSPEE